MEGTRVSRQGFGLGSGRFWRFAVLAATATVGVSSQAEAAIYYWQDSSPAATEPAPAPRKPPARSAKTQRRGDKKPAIVEKESKPQGPLIISVSIAQQKLRIYDANGLYAESPVSTGMPGHSTPMGVFSVIQKQKFHQSNIYSGAPMPFMQRITWSGIAMHAGVLPGHPASHGCIRLPMAFAVKMYGWTRMGARVIVTPGEITPESFSHPLLASVKVAPQPVAAQETKADAAPVPTTEKLEIKTTEIKTPAADPAIELRPTVGHTDDVRTASEAASKVKTADASGALPAALATNTMSDAAPGSEQPTQQTTAVSDATDSGKQAASRIAAETDTPKPETDPSATKKDETASSEAKPSSDGPAETPPAKVADGETKPADAAPAPPAKSEAASGKTARPTDNAAVSPAPATEAAKAAIAPPAATNEMPLKGDLKSDTAKAYLGPPLKKTEQIAVFVSRKDSKLYIRQNFAPLFDVPVTIATDERPLGTHIFTAQVDKNDANTLRWSVVSLPVPAKAAARHVEEVRVSRGRKIASPAATEAKPAPAPDSPAEALDRLNLPADVMAKIYEAVSTGGSIIVSDQGIAGGETGEGTDFIVSLR
ncbi:Lipoprotein-anchoring transpeptidase ErfK/SrfK [Bradyrhizobium erythrophlei]|jgi:lipoprotein-anchoring transpeptidase ErfK/SrfK|uniref:Lipoprotein-anchoring transpeptidase ErfK/SrfK n=1 Tax=Bradyrhizobium erythrophlei TaxID=1437360 RepID=A0A1M7UWR1_9BRAD|nr:L,D-transpeptidase family protein [Bradyrhizobium erythrophlei]SHN87471.1 Lipoprotein-anchoring transpeptidase ErfK/SrfK [Bradyrhizobium erythrophlei]